MSQEGSFLAGRWGEAGLEKPRPQRAWSREAASERRRAVREHYGRRGRSGDPEHGVKGLLVRNLEHLCVL